MRLAVIVLSSIFGWSLVVFVLRGCAREDPPLPAQALPVEVAEAPVCPLCPPCPAVEVEVPPTEPSVAEPLDFQAPGDELDPQPVEPTREDPPVFEAGSETVRLAVSTSPEQTKALIGKFNDLLDGTTWPHRVTTWRTTSGRDPTVIARLQIEGISEDAGLVLCGWLMGRGWEPGVHPCDLRQKEHD